MDFVSNEIFLICVNMKLVSGTGRIRFAEVTLLRRK